MHPLIMFQQAADCSLFLDGNLDFQFIKKPPKVDHPFDGQLWEGQFKTGCHYL